MIILENQNVCMNIFMSDKSTKIVERIEIEFHDGSRKNFIDLNDFEYYQLFGQLTSEFEPTWFPQPQISWDLELRFSLQT